ncbi:MAG: hypothetical protein ACFFCZ_20355 [Promethearchaeota archaeon]
MDNNDSLNSPNNEFLMKYNDFHQDSLQKDANIFEYGYMNFSEGCIREQVRDDLFGFTGSVLAPIKPNAPKSWHRLYQLHVNSQEDTSRLTRLLQLINPLLRFFPQTILEDIVRRMLSSPSCERRQNERTCIQILAFIESYLRSRGLSLTVNILKQIQTSIPILINQQIIFKEYYRLKYTKAPLYPACPIHRVIKGLIGQIIYELEISSTMKRAIIQQMQAFLPIKNINYPELYAWVIIRQILRLKGVSCLPKHSDSTFHKKILQLEYRIRKEERIQKKKQEPAFVRPIEQVSPKNRVFPEDFQNLLECIEIPNDIVTKLTHCYLEFCEEYRGQNLFVPLLSAIIQLGYYEYLGMTVRQLCQRWNVSRGHVYQFLKKIQSMK